MSNELIENYATGGDKVVLAVRGLSAEDLTAAPVPGKWSTHQVVIHLADAEMAFADRIRRIIATDDPTLLSWDENAFAANLCYAEQFAPDAVLLIEITRRQLGRVLRALPESALQRAGTHSERGRQTLADVLSFANRHLDHHLGFIAEKRAALSR